MPAALAPPPGVTSPPVGGGRYADYTSVSQWGLLSAYPTTITPLLSSYAAGNFYSWLGWNSASPAGGSLAAETPNLSGADTSLSDAAFAALALLQGEVQLDDPAVRADDAFTDADGTGNLPPMNPTPPALTPPGTPPPLAAPSTPPTPMSLEAAAAAPPAASPQSGGGTGSTGGSTQQAAPTGTSDAPSQAIQVFIILVMPPISDLTALSSSPSLFDPAQAPNPLQQSIFSKLEAAQSRPQLFLKPLEQSENLQTASATAAVPPAVLTEADLTDLEQLFGKGSSAPSASGSSQTFPALLEADVAELEEAGYTFLSDGTYAFQAADGLVSIPVVICHGQNATGPLPGLSPIDNFIGAGQWYRSGTAWDIMRNDSASRISGLATGIPSLANTVVAAGVFVVNAGIYAADGVPFDNEPLFPTDSWAASIQDALGADRSGQTYLTASGRIGGEFAIQLPVMLVASEGLAAVGSRGLAMLGPAAQAAEGLPLLLTESEVALSPALVDFTTPISTESAPLFELLASGSSRSSLAGEQLTLFEIDGAPRQLSLFALEGETNPFALEIGAAAAPARGQLSLFEIPPASRQLQLFVDTIGGETAAPTTASRIRSVVEFLKREGIADQAIRRSIIEAGLEGPIGSDTPITLARFRKLFPDTIARGKSFTGRLGDIEARVATLNEALAIENFAIIPKFEFNVSASGDSAWIDLVGWDRTSQSVVDAVQVIRGLPRAGDTFTFNEREFANAIIIDQAIGTGILRFVIVGP